MTTATLFKQHPGFFDLDFVRRSDARFRDIDDAALVDLLLAPQNPAPPDPNCIFRTQFYGRQPAPQNGGAPQNPIVAYLTEGAARDVWPNPFFDPVLFRHHHPHASQKPATVVEYALANIRHGLTDFHPFIDVEFIRARRDPVDNEPFFEDLFQERLDITHPHPLFDLDYLRTQTDQKLPDLAAGFDWYWRTTEDVATHALFDVEYYQSQLNAPDLVGRSVYHYLVSDGSVSPYPVFDPAYYRRNATAAGIAVPQRAFEHYLVTGQALGLNPSPYFDQGFYRRQSGCGAEPLQHYVDGGHRKHAPHPLITAGRDALLARASQAADQSIAYRLQRWPDQVPMSATPEIAPPYLARNTKSQETDPFEIRSTYFRTGYAQETLPNRLFSQVYMKSRANHAPASQTSDFQRYFHGGTHQRTRFMVVLDTLEDTARNRGWLAFLHSQISVSDYEFIVVCGHGGPLASAFLEVAHVWFLSQPEAATPPGEQIAISADRLMETLAGAAPVAAFMDLGGALDIATALAGLGELGCPVFGMIDPIMAAKDMSEIQRLAGVTDVFLCPNTSVKQALATQVPPERTDDIILCDADPARDFYGLNRGAARAQTRQRLAIPDDATVVLGSGPLDLENSIDLFGAIAARCIQASDQPEKLLFLWHGAGPSATHTPAFYGRYYVQSVASTDHFKLVDEPAIEDLFAAADIYLKSGRDGADTFGVNCAISAGLPCVVSGNYAAAVPETTEAAVRVVPPFDLTATVAAILETIAAPNPRAHGDNRVPSQQKTRFGIDFTAKINTALKQRAIHPLLGEGAVLAPKDAVLIVVPPAVVELAGVGPLRPSLLGGQDVICVTPGDNGALDAFETLVKSEPRLSAVDHAGFHHIVLCAGSEDLEPGFLAKFKHSIWMPDQNTRSADMLYQFGLNFDEILIDDPALITQLQATNPRIAALIALPEEAANDK